jgi:methylmalonyl-CoA mutase
MHASTVGADDILVVCGGVIPAQGLRVSEEGQCPAIYGPGTNIPAAAEVLSLIEKRRLAA